MEIAKIQDEIKKILESKKNIIKDNDPMIMFIKKNHVKIDNFCDDGIFHPFKSVWEYHFKGYWRDKLLLLEKYFSLSNGGKSIIENNNELFNLMYKIEKRAILLNPNPKQFDIKQKRLCGDEVYYKFIRSYWIDDKGNKKRLIARHIGFKEKDMIKTIETIFYDRGYGRMESHNDIEKYIEKNSIGIKAFEMFLMFNELLKRFENEYSVI
jgi:hypothetical protein